MIIKRNNKYDKLLLETIINTSHNFSEVLKKLGENNGCGNRRTLKRYIKKYEIPLSHFRTSSEHYQNTLKIVVSKRRQSLNEILIINSTYNNTSNLKLRLYNEGLKERECELCGQGEEWQGKKMSLILDHKNGIWDDNRLFNLRIVCPNCNATLDTHCGKNKKVH